MDGLAFYLYGFPVLFAAALVSLFFIVFRDRNLPQTHLVALACFANYSLANIFFVWVWEGAMQWREGLLIISSLVVVSLTVGQLVLALKVRASRVQAWLATLLFVAFLFLNLPITLISLFRAGFSG